MKYMFSLVFCFFCFTGFSQTQAEMNMMQYESYKKADKKLNEVYQAILKEYKSDAEEEPESFGSQPLRCA